MTPDLIAGRYRVVRSIGRGGMGVVWLCQDEVLGREVAVKQVGAFPGESAPDAARALREARSSAALNHRNVVSVFDIVDTEDGHVWLVMEYVPSRTLAEMLREDGPLPPRRAARIAAQVADGLAAAHAAGTIHRDVKPGNVLVGADDLAKISDFGIARRADEEQLTRTGLVTGTPSYFSPELARGEDPAPPSDVYALGATLYTVIEGRAPYPEQRNAIAMLQQIAASAPPPPERAGPLTNAVNRMMDRDPRSRWTMADAAQALRRLGAQDDDHPTAVIAAGGAGGAAAAGSEDPRDTEPGPPADGEPEPTPEPPHEESERRPGRQALPWLVAGAVLLLALVTGSYLLLSSGDDGPPEAAPTPTAKSTSPSRENTPSPTPSPTPTPSTEPKATEQKTTAPPEQGRTGPAALEGIVRDYFTAMPGDTATGWTMLAPSMRAQGRRAYEDFWADVDSVTLHRADAAGQNQVEIELTYRFTDGRTVRETQLVTMEEHGGDYRIADDEVLSSRTMS